MTKLKVTLLICWLMIPIFAWAANCDNPIGETYSGKIQNENVLMSFYEPYGGDPYDGILSVVINDEVYYTPYTWDNELCRATLITTSDSNYYMDKGDGWFDLTTTPRFKFEHKTTVN